MPSPGPGVCTWDFQITQQKENTIRSTAEQNTNKPTTRNNNFTYGMSAISRKRLRTVSPVGSQEIDPEKCIICQRHDPQLRTSGTENGKLAVIRAAGIREDSVLERLQHVDQCKFVYHVSNDCYKKYTLKKTLENWEKLKLSTQAATSDPSPQQSTSTGAQMRRHSSAASRDPASRTDEVDIFSKACFICGHAKHNNKYQKWRISEKSRAELFLKAALSLQDKVYTRTSDLQNANAVFGGDLYCHNVCIRNYIRKGEKQSSDHGSPSIGQQKLHIFANVMKNIEPGLNSGRCYNLSYLSDCCNQAAKHDCQNVTAFRNSDVKLYLINIYGDNVSFFIPPGSKAPTIFFKGSAANSVPMNNHEELDSDMLKRCGSLLRNCF